MGKEMGFPSTSELSPFSGSRSRVAAAAWAEKPLGEFLVSRPPSSPSSVADAFLDGDV